jgi:two-component system, chemotaxis family, chemotaxis protein CheY
MTPTPLTPLNPGSIAFGSRATAEPSLILLVEDDFMLRGSLAAVLESEGYRVESAANALDALRRLEHPPKPSLILLDIMLPYMDGLEFRALQRAAPAMADIPVIVITAVGIRPDVAVELDLRQAFFKPLERPRLLDAIRRHLTPSTG